MHSQNNFSSSLIIIHYLKFLIRADECLAAVPEIEGIDYTLQEYLEMLKHIQQVIIIY